MEKVTKLTVVVCTYNRSEILKYCLDSLENQSVNKSNYEVIVVDNNSTDNTKEVVEEYCINNNNFRYVFEPVQGLSNARNRGWRESKADWIAYIDDDAKADEKWCENIIETSKKDSDLKAFGGEILNWYLYEKPKWFKNEFRNQSMGNEKFVLNIKTHPFGLTGCNMIFKKEALLKYGGFSKEFGMIGREIGLAEESKLFNEMLIAKEKIMYFPDIKIYHLVPKEIFSLRYVFSRSVKSGESIAKIRKTGLLSIDFLKKVLMMFFRFTSLFFYSIPGLFFKLLLYEKLTRAGYFYGYVKETVKNEPKNEK
jgi:glycosyltransferase involved in cell wall biosynthesis